MCYNMGELEKFTLSEISQMQKATDDDLVWQCIQDRQMHRDRKEISSYQQVGGRGLEWLLN